MPPTAAALADRAVCRLSTLRRTKQPTSAHILPQSSRINPPSNPHPLHINPLRHAQPATLQCYPTDAPRSRSALCRPAMPPYWRASQPLGALPPCNASLWRILLRRPRASSASGILAAAGAEPAVVASSVVAESAVLLAVTTSWLLVASWFLPSAPSSLLAPPTFLPPTRSAPPSPPYGRRPGRDAPPPCPCKAPLLLPRTGRASLCHNRPYVKLRKLRAI